jgi:hypothetical protein
VITHKDFETLGFQFGADHELSIVTPDNRGVYQASIVHIPDKYGAFNLFGPIRAGYYGGQYGGWSDALCAVFPTADALYAYMIEQTLRRSLTFTQLAAGEER